MKRYVQNQVQKALAIPPVAKVSGLFSTAFSGIGSVVMFHRIIPSDSPVVCEDLEVTAAQLEAILQYFIDNDYELVSLDQAHAILNGEAKVDKKFAVFTFDDGYKDNFTIAYPIFKKYNVPFAIYVTTSFPDKTAIIWWYALKEYVSRCDDIDFLFAGGHYKYKTETELQKKQAHTELRGLILLLAEEEQSVLFDRLFTQNGIDLNAFSSSLTMDWDEVVQLAADPLVTIGAHTVNHRNLKQLEEGMAKKEMLDSKQRIEKVTGVAVDHFAFPFGSRNEAGEREFRLARELGFKTSTTTRCGNIFPEHAAHLNCLPRITPSPYMLSSFPQLYANGFVPAIKHKFKKVVTF